MTTKKDSMQTNGFTGAIDLFAKSWQLIKENLSMFILVYSLPILMAILGVGSGKTDTTNTSISYSENFTAMLGVGVGIAAVMLVALLVLQTMAVGLQLQAAKGKKPDAPWLWEFARTYFFRLFGLSIIIGLLVFGGLILLIVPGLIAITRYFLAPYVMIDEDLGILAALSRSAEISKGYWKQIWGVIGVTIFLAIVPSLFLGRVGDLVASLLGAAYGVAPALRYLELKKAAANV